MALGFYLGVVPMLVSTPYPPQSLWNPIDNFFWMKAWEWSAIYYQEHINEKQSVVVYSSHINNLKSETEHMLNELLFLVYIDHTHSALNIKSKVKMSSSTNPRRSLQIAARLIRVTTPVVSILVLFYKFSYIYKLHLV